MWIRCHEGMSHDSRRADAVKARTGFGRDIRNANGLCEGVKTWEKEAWGHGRRRIKAVYVFFPGAWSSGGRGIP